ncbi:alpha/beta hydrolase [Aspergillus terreus]|uniref:Alpha/beta hydrolase n=1 Tax=Aspergillus terreus TaxID=33178 RepID=A0A5M3Z2F7_ASPTE|nr:hypothetical protein ATETN484_0006022300 [Aspergillus terreus]GFF19964.1 alpha/beta hydrolase [Aspergillus terreus]
MPSIITSAIYFPFLLFFSIPLAFTAYLTVCASILVVFARLSLISLELVRELFYAVVSKNFIIPKSDSWSLFNFAPSEPTTPRSVPRRRSGDYGAPHMPTTPTSQLWSSRSQPDLSHRPFRRTSSISSDGVADHDHFSYHHDVTGRPTHWDDGRRPTPLSFSGAFQGFISGDEGRDFEGLGGWRCGPSVASRLHGANTHPSRASSTSSRSRPANDTVDEAAADDDEDDPDERAWLSINRRLALPSQPLSHRNSGADLGEHILPWRHRQMVASPSAGRESPTRRHHNRSATTSMLVSLARRERPLSPSGVSLSTTPALSPSSRAISPRSHSQAPSPVTVPTIDSQISSPPADRSGGYFAARPGGSSAASSATSLEDTTPMEERRPSRAAGRSVAHYPAGVRYRRRSLSGPNPAGLFSPWSTRA